MYDICGVQPMSPNRSNLRNEVTVQNYNVQLQVMNHLQSTNQYLVSQVTPSTQSNDTSGLGTLAAVDSAGAAADFGGGMSTDAEGLGSGAGSPNSAFAEMGFTIENDCDCKITCVKTEYYLNLHKT